MVKPDSNYKLFIDGQWVDGKEGKTFKAANPANGETLATCVDAGKEDVDLAVQAAWKAFQGWKQVSPQERSRMLLKIADLIDAILPIYELDGYVEAPLVMMAAVPGDKLDPKVEKAYRAAVDRHAPQTPPIARMERFAFYDRAKEAFAVVMTGETAKYGNLILKKGVTPGK